MAEKRIFITGGASGLGKEIAKHFARNNYKVCIGDVNQAQGLAFESELRELNSDCFFIRCDVTERRDFEAVADALQERWGGLDILVNNAGVAGTIGEIQDISSEDWRWTIDVNLMGPIHGCQTFIPAFIRQGHGHIVNIASVAGLINPPRTANYSATKAALVSLSESLRVELIDHKDIHISLVCPGFFQSGLSDSLKTGQTIFRDRLKKVMKKSKVSAESIAKDVFQATQSKRFLILTHREYRSALRIKRLFPKLFLKILDKQSKQFYRTT